MQYYDQSGELLKRRGKASAYYFGSEGKFTKVPTMTSSRKEILNFLEVCMKTHHPDLTRGDLEQMWDDQRNRLPEIIDYLEALKDKYAASTDPKDRWRLITYNKALRVLKTVEVPIVSGKQAQKLPGIGAGISKKIDEILQTGGLKFIDVEGKAVKERSEKRKVTDLFQGIWQVGSSKANQWYGQGYRTLEDIRRYELDTLSESQKETLKYYVDLQRKIPRKDIEYSKEFFEVALYAIPEDVENVKFALAGSYRRGLKTSGDLDILVSSKEIGRSILKQYVDALVEDGTVIYVLQESKNKITTLIQLFGGKVAKADFFYVPWDSWGTGLLAWTGSKDFVVRMRADARRKGCKLTDESLSKGGKTVPTPTEKSVFKALGMKYVPPEKRY